MQPDKIHIKHPKFRKSHQHNTTEFYLEFFKAELWPDKVAADEEAVGEHLEKAGGLGQGRLGLVLRQDYLALFAPALPVVDIKRQS